MKNTDLHTHSYYSDGQISPRELVKLAKKRGIKNLALTDHDSIRGVKEAMKEGKRVGVNVIPAVEIRCSAGEILGYFIDVKNKKLINELNKSVKKEQEKVKDICKKLSKAGYKISYKELRERFHKSRNNLNTFYPIYMLYLKKYTKKSLEGSKVIKDLKPKKIKTINVIKAIKLIKDSGGVPVLAHPWIKEANGLKRINSLVKAGLKGIEINNGDRAPFRKKIFDKKIKSVAKKYNLIITSGSDFHGTKMVKVMPGNHDLGKNNCDEKIVEKLRRISPLGGGK